MTQVVVHLSTPPAILSPNVRRHWAAKGGAVKGYREACGWMFKSVRRHFPKDPVPIIIDVEYRATRGCGGAVCYDEDNARASLKAAIDGMVDAGIIPTDSKKWLRWGDFTLITNKRSAAWKARGDGVTITIRMQPCPS